MASAIQATDNTPQIAAAYGQMQAQATQQGNLAAEHQQEMGGIHAQTKANSEAAKNAGEALNATAGLMSGLVNASYKAG
jgi:hypothetical protein